MADDYKAIAKNAKEEEAEPNKLEKSDLLKNPFTRSEKTDYVDELLRPGDEDDHNDKFRNLEINPDTLPDSAFRFKKFENKEKKLII